MNRQICWSKLGNGALLLALAMVLATISCAVLGQPGTAMAQGTDYYFDGASAQDSSRGVAVCGVTSGNVSFNAENKTLKLDNATITDYVIINKDITINLVGTNTGNVCDEYHKYDFTVVGTGSLSGNMECDSFTLRGGKIGGNVDCQGATILGGTVTGEIYCVSNTGNGHGPFTMSGGKATGPITCGNFMMSGGAIAIKGASDAIYFDGNFTMKKGTITLKSPDQGIYAPGYDHKTHLFKMSGGTITVTNPKWTGVLLFNCNLKMTGGTLAVAKSHDSGIRVCSSKYRGKTYGGKVSITGGSVSITNRKGNDRYGAAIEADLMSNKPGCLKSILGRLPKGAKFKAKGNVYRVFDASNVVSLVKYCSKKKKAKLNSFKYGGNPYEVHRIESKAFNTKKGKKVVSLTCEWIETVDAHAFQGAKSLKTITLSTPFFCTGSIGNYAFAGTKSLKKLKLWLRFNSTHSKNGRLKSLKFFKGAVAKHAFAKCGKKGGKGLTMVVNAGLSKRDKKKYGSYMEDRIRRQDLNKYKALLKKHGLSSGAKLEAEYEA